MTKWLPVYEYEGLYEVSDMGEVRNAKTKRLRKPSVDKDGFNRVELRLGGKRRLRRVKRVVMEVFAGRMVHRVISINGDNGDDRLENIKYDIPSKAHNKMIIRKIKALLKKREYMLGGVADKRIIISIKGDSIITRAVGSYNIILQNGKDNVVKMKDVKHYKEPTVETLSIALRYYDEKCR